MSNITRSPTELLPCPFCGSDAELDEHEGLTSSRHYTATVQCGHCDQVWGEQGWGKSRGEANAEAIMRWNTRQPTASQEALIESLEAARGTLTPISGIDGIGKWRIQRAIELLASSIAIARQVSAEQQRAAAKPLENASGYGEPMGYEDEGRTATPPDYSIVQTIDGLGGRGELRFSPSPAQAAEQPGEISVHTPQAGYHTIPVHAFLPEEGRAVIVAGGLAKYRRGIWYSGMEEPPFSRPIEWKVEWWMPIPTEATPGYSKPVSLGEMARIVADRYNNDGMERDVAKALEDQRSRE